MSKLDHTLVRVRKGTGSPLAAQVAELIVRNLEEGVLRPGDRLPTERELAEALGVARGTVKAAYRLLERRKAIHTRQGSGSYVSRDESAAGRLRREEAEAILLEAVGRLRELGFDREGIARLADRCLAEDGGRVDIALVSDSAEVLLDLNRQLSRLPGVSASIFILDSLTQSRNPEELLRGFRFLVAPTNLYPLVKGLLPGLGDRVVEVAISPGSDTLIALTALPRSARIGIICRTHVFLAHVKALLLSHGFEEDNIFSFFEMDYTTSTYFPGGINALISFGGAHIFTSPDFTFRNEEFYGKGGVIIPFQYQMERGSQIYLEDRIRRG